MKNILNILFFLTAGSLLYSQEYLITGVITDQQNHPLDYASVALYEGETFLKEAYTNEKGFFELKAPKGTYRLEIDFFGNNSKTIDPFIIESDKNLGTIALQNETNEIETVSVTAEKKVLEYKLDKKVYNVSADKTLVGATTLDALDNAPSVTVDVEGNVSLRGDDNVTILVDGKPSSLITGGNTDLLRSLPADSIEKIEVVTVPSARYDADGSTGIINIVMKKGKKSGLNGSVSARSGYPITNGASVNLNYRTEKYNLYSNIGADYRVSPGNGSTYNRYYGINGAPDQISDMTREHKRKTKSTFINTGIDYYLNDHNTLSFNTKLGYNKGDNESNLRYNEYFSNNIANATLRTRDEFEDETDTRLELGLGYIRTFKKEGHKLTVDGKFNYREDDEVSDINEDDNGVLNYQKTNILEGTKDYLFQTDYILPLGKEGQFEAGLKLNLLDLDNDYALSDYNSLTQQYEPNQNYTNSFAYTQMVNAAYMQYGNSLGNFSFLAGLRLEDTRISMDNVEIENIWYDTFEKKYTDFFPTLHLSYSINDNNSVQVGYSRRIRRPRTRMLNPFRSFSDNTNIFKGNPNIDPMYTNAFELSYIYSPSKLTLSSSIYYNSSTNPFQFFSESITDNQGNTIIQNYPVNLDSEKRYGVEIGVQYKMSKWLNITGDFNYFKADREGEVIESDGDIRDQSTDADGMFARFGATTKLPYDIGIQVRGDYRGSMKGADTDTNPMFSMNLAITKEVLQKKGSITFNVSDLFNTRRRGHEVHTSTYYSDSDFQWRERQWTLNFVYRFGNNKKERPKKEFNNGGGGEEDDFSM
ncbi:MAG: TonB-dependent receptor domain-containing protein [Flavobacteriales bacterium]